MVVKPSLAELLSLPYESNQTPPKKANSTQLPDSHGQPFNGRIRAMRRSDLTKQLVDSEPCNGHHPRTRGGHVGGTAGFDHEHHNTEGWLDDKAGIHGTVGIGGYTDHMDRGYGPWASFWEIRRSTKPF